MQHTLLTHLSSSAANMHTVSMAHGISQHAEHGFLDPVTFSRRKKMQHSPCQHGLLTHLSSSAASAEYCNTDPCAQATHKGNTCAPYNTYAVQMPNPLV